MSEQEPPIVELTHIPEVFADGFLCVSCINGVARLPFFSVVQTSEDMPATRRVVARLALPLGALVGMHDALGNVVAMLKTQGVLVEQGRS